MKKCPHCEAEIDCLRYSVEIREWGNHYFEADEHESADSEWSNDPVYNCPECDEEICPDDLLELEDNNQEQESQEPAVIDQRSEMVENTIPRSYHESYFICPKCKSKLGCEDTDEIITCYACGTEVGQFNSQIFNQ